MQSVGFVIFFGVAEQVAAATAADNFLLAVGTSPPASRGIAMLVASHRPPMLKDRWFFPKSAQRFACEIHGSLGGAFQ